ncbi:MAG TPA: TetR/AcrR family transcriptional regulator [Sphingobium sp.]|nr:TetR/AcrR family transcriptional regulator [Sphingobium sp.]
MDLTLRPTSRRETGRLARRKRIVDAAQALVRERGIDDVSMVQIAERAEVSPATLYNLFETKSAIFWQVLDRETEDYERRVARKRPKDALEGIFVAVEVAVARFLKDPQFHRVMAVAGEQESERLGFTLSRRRVAFWSGLVAEAVVEGRLREDTDSDLIGRTLAHLIAGIFQYTPENSAKRLNAEIAFGFSLILSAVSTGDSRSGLEMRAAEAQKQLPAGKR